MIRRERAPSLVGVLIVGLVGSGVLSVVVDAPLVHGTYQDLYLPLLMRSVGPDDLPTPSIVTLTPTLTPTATGTATSTGTVTPTPTATLPPTPTEPFPTGRIHGRMTFNGEDMAPGFGYPGFPQIELWRQTAGQWETIANTVTEEGGRFQFVDPPPLEEGQVYQVVWRNDLESGLGADLWLHRWWSRSVAEFGDGTDVDVGVFEMADLTYGFPCHDCHRSLPITFQWNPRENESEVYRWSLFKECGHPEKRHEAYRTQSLGHASEYTLEAPPPGFKYDEVYCWYIFIEDGVNGTGWPFHAWRTAFLSLPLELNWLDPLEFLPPLR